MDALEGVMVHREVSALEHVEFALAFAITNAQLQAEVDAVLPRAQGDAVVWFAYPRGSSRRYKREFNRDSGWASMGAAGLEGARMVAIDEDWSALRFRRVEHVRTMKRDVSRAGTGQGGARVATRISSSARWIRA
ncbi:MAG TPA: hypothetical protein VHG93_09145 [Longimicrobium sp.]|nr:hypothetical protein [Longimicrobium sp.]